MNKKRNNPLTETEICGFGYDMDRSPSLEPQSSIVESLGNYVVSILKVKGVNATSVPDDSDPETLANILLGLDPDYMNWINTEPQNIVNIFLKYAQGNNQ